MTTISRRVSAEVIRGMQTAYPAAEVAQILGLNCDDLILVAARKKRLSIDQLERVAKSTGKSWRSWLLDASWDVEPSTVNSVLREATALLVETFDRDDEADAKCGMASKTSDRKPLAG